MENIINAMLNLVIVSVPEETIWLLMTMIALKRFDLLDRYRWRENIKFILLPIITTAISINLFRYIIIIPKPIMTLISIIVFNVFIIYILKRTSFIEDKWLILKTLLFSFINLFIIILIENLYIVATLSILQISIDTINMNWLSNFLFSLPPRVLQILLVVYFLSRKENNLYLRVTKNIFYDRKICITIGVLITVLISIWIFSIQILGNYNILQLFTIGQQLFIGVMILFIPTILLGGLIYLVMCFTDAVSKIQKSHQNMFDDDYIN